MGTGRPVQRPHSGQNPPSSGGICVLRRTGPVPQRNEVANPWARSKERWKLSLLQARLAKHKAVVPGPTVPAFHTRARSLASRVYARLR